MKKVLAFAGAGVLIYSLIVYPVELANGTQTVIGWITTGVKAAITFMNNVYT